MNEQDKQLLFKDLCARLPYGVKLKIWLNDGITEECPLDIKHNYADVLLDFFYYNKIKDCKPYLRPMSSMTDEEKSLFLDLRNALTYQENGEYDFDDFNELNNFLNKRKLDRYGLIDMGLAIEAPKDMYKI